MKELSDIEKPHLRANNFKKIAVLAYSNLMSTFSAAHQLSTTLAFREITELISIFLQYYNILVTNVD